MLATISSIEAIWILITGTGLYFAFRLFREAQADLKAFRASGRGDHQTEIIAKASRRWGFIVTLYMAWYLYLGINGAFQPDPPVERTRFQWLLLGLFIGFQALFTAGLWLNLRARPKPEG